MILADVGSDGCMSFIGSRQLRNLVYIIHSIYNFSSLVKQLLMIFFFFILFLYPQCSYFLFVFDAARFHLCRCLHKVFVLYIPALLFCLVFWTCSLSPVRHFSLHNDSLILYILYIACNKSVFILRVELVVFFLILFCSDCINGVNIH